MKIIYISGIDGCGKTTQAKLLLKQLQTSGIDAQYLWLRWEPSFRRFIAAFRSAKRKSDVNTKQRVDIENAEQTDWLHFKRRILTNPLSRRIWLYYACGDYYLSYKKRLKKIRTDVIVIDRFVNDFIIDQAVNLDIPPNSTYAVLNNFFLNKFHFPDFNIIIDLPAREGYTRKNDGTPLSYLKTREKYYHALQGENTLHLDGLQSIEKLEKQIHTWVTGKIEAKTR